VSFESLWPVCQRITAAAAAAAVNYRTVDRYVALTLSATYACHSYRAELAEIMPYVDILFGNRREARAYAAANELSTDDISNITRHIACLPKANGRRGRIVVITCGSQPTVVAEDGIVTRSTYDQSHTTATLV